MTEDNLIKQRKKIIAQLTQARMENGMTQEQLAQKLGTKRSAICRIESGTQNVSLDFLLKMASALGREPDVTFKEGRETMNRYSLRLYDEELLTFSLKEGGLKGLRAEPGIVHVEKKELFPLDLEISEKGIIKWLENRVIPKNRAFVDEILKTLGLSANNTKGIIDVCKGLSLNDSYWVVPEGFTGKFSEYNLYENRFSEALSLVAYTGAGASREAFSTSPELTTNGMLRKAWRLIEDDGIYLYKGGTIGLETPPRSARRQNEPPIEENASHFWGGSAANAGNEPYSEYYASQIAERMGLNAVHYDLENWKGILASKCRLFTDIDTAYIPVGRIVREGGIRACLDYYETLGPEFSEQLRSMLVFDALIYNEDRHFGNFGLLRDNHTGRLSAPAPIFDNGVSLFNYAMPEDIRDLPAYAGTRSTPYHVSFEDICREVMGAKQKRQLRRMIGFRFRRHPLINLSEERLCAIETFLQSRTQELLAIPKA
ncbi:MAG: helix-turn-helix domain-containing protein [Clostridiales bacterium]|nr:helix-turn-helix domain-containing protein [Clostridiales bacterium]